MIICESCGTQNEDGTNFCTNKSCRRYLSPSSRVATPSGTASQPGVAAPDFSAPQVPVEPVMATPQAPVTPTFVPPQVSYQIERQRMEPIAVGGLPNRADTGPQQGQLVSEGNQGLLVALVNDRVDVKPGGEGSVTLQVQNKGSVVDSIDVAVIGVPDSWVTIEPKQVNLFVGAEVSLRIRIAPPLEAGTRPGPMPAEVAVWSSTNPNVRCTQHLHIQVSPFAELETTIEPASRTGRNKVSFDLSVRNGGNRTLKVQVRGGDADGAVGVRCTPARFEAAPGAQTAIAVTAKLPVFPTGPPVMHAVKITVDAGTESRDLPVSIKQLPILSKLLARLLMLAGVAVVAAAVVVFLAYRHNRPFGVPNVVGAPQAAAQSTVTGSHFKFTMNPQPDPNNPAGQVTAQNPPAGSKHKHGTNIVLTVSTGPPPFALPQVTGDVEDQAQNLLENDKLKVISTTQSSLTAPAGQVLAQTPAAGSQVKAGDTVNLTVSSGKPTASVPNIVGLSEQNAISICQQAGLVYAHQADVISSSAPGQILSQSPQAGAQVSQGSTVFGTVAQAPPTTLPPPTAPPAAATPAAQSP